MNTLEQENKILKEALSKISFLDHSGKEMEEVDSLGDVQEMDLTHAEDLQHLEEAILYADRALRDIKILHGLIERKRA